MVTIHYEDGSSSKVGSKKWNRVHSQGAKAGGKKSNCGGSAKAASPTKSKGQCTSGSKGKKGQAPVGSRYEDGSRKTHLK